jgi:hypothetical protein
MAPNYIRYFFDVKPLCGDEEGSCRQPFTGIAFLLIYRKFQLGRITRPVGLTSLFSLAPADPRIDKGGGEKIGWTDKLTRLVNS